MKQTAADILSAAAATFRERNAVYKDNYKQVGVIMAALCPNGRELLTAEDFAHWHLVELLVVKLTRFANTDFTHRDSLRDIQVYAAMIESLLTEEE